MNIQQLKYFIEVANTKNLTAAARNLFVTQPTLSLSLKKLESELQTSLFQHQDKPYQLTETGLYLFEHALPLVEGFEQLSIDIQTMSTNTANEKTKIRLGITTLFSIQFMEEISTFIQSHPTVDLIIKQGGSAKLQKMLVDKEIDFGLLSYPNIYPKNLVYEELNDSKTGYHVSVVMPKSNPLSSRKELTFEDLQNERFSSFSTNFMLGRLLVNRTNECGYKPNIVLYNDDLQVLLHSLNKNNSICLLPIEYKEVNNSSSLVWIPLKDKYNFFPIGIALRKNYKAPREMDEFIELIRQY